MSPSFPIPHSSGNSYSGHQLQLDTNHVRYSHEHYLSRSAYGSEDGARAGSSYAEPSVSGIYNPRQSALRQSSGVHRASLSSPAHDDSFYSPNHGPLSSQPSISSLSSVDTSAFAASFGREDAMPSVSSPVGSQFLADNCDASRRADALLPVAPPSNKSRRDKNRIELAPDQPLTTQGKPRTRVYVACVQWRVNPCIS